MEIFWKWNFHTVEGVQFFQWGGAPVKTKCKISSYKHNQLKRTHRAKGNKATRKPRQDRKQATYFSIMAFTLSSSIHSITLGTTSGHTSSISSDAMKSTLWEDTLGASLVAAVWAPSCPYVQIVYNISRNTWPALVQDYCVKCYVK